MEKHDLAQRLRDRQRNLKRTKEEYLQIMSDDQIIDSYITCYECKTKMLDGNDLEVSIKASKDVEDFLVITERENGSKEFRCKTCFPKSSTESLPEHLIPNYVACVTGYYKQGTVPGEVCRLTVAISDLKKEKLIYDKEYLIDECDLTEEQVIEEMVKKAKEYNCDLRFNPNPVLLEKCRCGCNAYLTNFISRSDYIEMQLHFKKNVLVQPEMPEKDSLFDCKDVLDSRILPGKLPEHTICIAHYYKTDPENLCRTTIVVTNLRSNKIVFQKQYWIDENTDLGRHFLRIKDSVEDKVKRFKGVVITSENPILLQRYPGEKVGYLFANIDRDYYIKLAKEKRNKQPQEVRIEDFK